MIFLLLVIYQLKHFLADFPLQGKYMLGKFKAGYSWILPLIAHVFVHGLFTFIITLFIKPKLALYLTLFDMIIHFTMDRIKASPDLLGRFQPFTKKEYKQGVTQQQIKSNILFWWSLGLDQMIHHLTHYIIIWELIK